jgi:guanylate kinase
MEKKKIIILTGPSGAGKTELANYLLEHYSGDFSKFITHTSREMRPGEQNGHEYYFRSPEDFKKEIKRNSFFEYEEVFQNCFYGCSTEELKRISLSNKLSLLVVDVNGALKFAGKSKSTTIDLQNINPIIFYIHCPIEELINRIKKDNENRKRNDTKKTLEKRYERMVYELSQKNQFNNIIDNFGKHPHLSGNELVNKIFETIKNK